MVGGMAERTAGWTALEEGSWGDDWDSIGRTAGRTAGETTGENGLEGRLGDVIIILINIY